MAAPPNGPVVFLLGGRTSHQDFQTVAGANGWIVYEERPPAGPNQPYEQIWVTSDRRTAIHYMDDPTPRERFVVVYGPDTGDVAFDLGVGCDIRTAEDVSEAAQAAASEEDIITAAWQLCVTHKHFDLDVMGVLKQFYQGGSALVRHAVVNAVGYRGWQESMGFLEGVARSDPDGDLRENARSIVEAWKKVRRAATPEP